MNNLKLKHFQYAEEVVNFVNKNNSIVVAITSSGQLEGEEYCLFYKGEESIITSFSSKQLATITKEEKDKIVHLYKISKLEAVIYVKNNYEKVSLLEAKVFVEKLIDENL